MQNTKKSKVNAILYVMLILITAAVVFMTVFSFAANRKTKVNDPVTTEQNKTEPSPKKTADEPQKKPEATEKEQETEQPNGKEANAGTSLKYTNPVNGFLAKGFSIDMPVYSNTMDDYRAHTGIDIQAELGSPVMSFADGNVKSVYDDALMGKCISIDHGNGLVSYYMGLSDEVCDGIEEGAPVYCGQVISSVGDSTLVEIGEENHLHFEVMKNNMYVDPLSYVSFESSTSQEAIEQSYEG